ncbi:MAG: type IV pilus secretin PilQ [Pyrinomonadaceae bacterium]
MNSLIKIRATVSKIVTALVLVTAFAISISAQRTDPQSQGKMYGDPGFKGEVIDLNVVNADVREILNYITDQYGINFVIDKSVKETPVTVKVKDVPWNVALDSILQAQELGVQVNGNILRVASGTVLASEGALLRERQNNQIDTSSLVTELIRLNYATASGSIKVGTTTSGTATDSGNSGASGAAGASGTQAGGDGLLPIIKRRLSRRGSIEIDSRSNSLIITDVPVNVAAVKQLIAILDQPEPQVEIEARIVVASRTFSRDIGVQLAGIVTGGRNSGASIGTLPGATTGLPIPTGLPIGSINNSLASSIANTAIGLTTGIFGTAQLSALISAGEKKGEVKVIATPRVTALNNRPAEIKNSTQIPITTIQPNSGTGSAVIATTTYVDVPLRLSITPQITDLGTVILNVVAENSSTAQIAAGAPPAINTQSMTTQVTVPDGGTTVVGGVLFDDERESQDRTPGLASIPILGNLFKRKGIQRNTNEILFFITPRITRPDYNAQVQSGTAPRGPAIAQPVPMGNPSSNSSPTPAPTPPGIILQSPGLAVPEGPASPIKPKE